MAIDFDRVNSKLEKLNQKNERNNILWKPKPGQQIIRLIPYAHCKGYPFMELMFHFGVNGKNFLSPSTFGRPDPLKDFAEKLASSGDKDEWEMSKQITPKMRTYAPILVRGEEEEGVKYWGFGTTVYETILGYINSVDYGDITDWKQGRDITVTFKTAKELGKQYPETTIMVKPNITPAVKTKELFKIAQEQPEITTIFKEPSYNDLKEELRVWLGEESEDVPSGDEKLGSEPSDEKTEDSPAEVKSDESADEIASQFEDMFEDEKKD